ncbi:DUF4126 family protein [Rhizobium ruizarguesonis]
MIVLLALTIGIVAGLRAFTAPAAVAWGAALLHFDVSSSGLSFMGSVWAAWILTALACVELVTDQLPSTPSRKVPVQFGARLLMGALAGGTLGAADDLLAAGIGLGVFGAVIGTLGGASARRQMAAAFGRNRPAALIEDAVALLGALLIVCAA